MKGLKVWDQGLTTYLQGVSKKPMERLSGTRKEVNQRLKKKTAIERDYMREILDTYFTFPILKHNSKTTCSKFCLHISSGASQCQCKLLL